MNLSRLLGLVLSLLLLPALAGAQALDPLVITGTAIKDSAGRTVILHGVNVVYKKAPYYPSSSGAPGAEFNAADAKRLRSWGMNTIRLGVTWKGLQPKPGAIDGAYAKHIESLARLAGRYGLYVLIDMHQDVYAEQFNGNGAPDWAVKTDGVAFSSLGPFPINYYAPAVGHAFANFWENRDGIRSQYVSAFAQLAARLKGNNYILGYDAFNEPTCDLSTKPCGLPPEVEATQRWLKPFYDELYPAMAKADPNHPVFYEEGVQVNFGWPFHFGSTPDLAWPFKNAGLSFHSYCSELIRKDVNCLGQESKTFEGAIQAATKNKVAPLLTEFGATDEIPTLERLVDTADRFGVGWQYWQYKSYQDPTTQAGDDLVKADAESIVDRNGKVKQAKVLALARPYPERIGGSGATWHFNVKTRKFTFRLKRGSGITQIVVPKIQYRSGFKVAASGASTKVDRSNGKVTVIPRNSRSSISLNLAPTLSGS